MTPDRLEEIRRKTEAATPGPWETQQLADWPGRSEGIWVAGDETARIVKTDSGMYPPEWPDAEFIALARSAIPELIAEVERLRAEVAACDEKVKKAVVEAWEDALR